jgi:uncharacterized protein (UPF0264 family)
MKLCAASIVDSKKYKPNPMGVIDSVLNGNHPGLLVSVRSAAEAQAALAGGADVIDVKEPSRGSLGAADYNTICDVVRAVAGRVPVTAAAGELVELIEAPSNAAPRPMPLGVAYAKIGLAHCGKSRTWIAPWRAAVAALQKTGDAAHAQPVAVIYADWRKAQSPEPERIHSAALDIHCRTILIDTWDKTAGSLFDHWPASDLKSFLRHARDTRFAVVLAGSLSGANLLRAAELRPNLVAVRGAACDTNRNAEVSLARVANLRRALDAFASTRP